MIGKILGAVASPVISAAGQLFGMKKQNQYNVAAQETAHDNMKELAQHQYQWAVDDLKKAGLNPILAATGGGIQGASATSRPIPSVGLPDMALGDSLTSARQLQEVQKKQARLAEERQESEIEQMQSQSRLNDATTAFQMAQEQREKENLKLIPLQAMNLADTNMQIHAMVNKLNQEARTASAFEAFQNAQTREALMRLGVYEDNKDTYADAIMAALVRSGSNPLLSTSFFTSRGANRALRDKGEATSGFDLKEIANNLSDWFSNYRSDRKVRKAETRERQRTNK